MKFYVLTLFPEIPRAFFENSIMAKAVEKGIIAYELVNIRDFAFDKHKTCDDSPYGGGAGMLMMAQPIYDCFMKVCSETEERPHLIYMSPCGKTLTQERVKELAEMPNIAILCGRYEGVDQLVIDEIVDEEISIGDYVVTGGEMPAMILADAVSRMLPGVLSQPEGYMGESHYSSLLEYPQYTKPPVWHDMAVPDVLSSGHHANIKKWQRERSIERTFERRPELLENADLDKKERAFLEDLKKSVK